MSPSLSVVRWARCSLSALLLCGMPSMHAQSPDGSARAAQALEHARQQGPLALYAWFHDMPKGAELHTHLAGAVYAETFIREAVEDHLCVRTKTLTLYKTMAMSRSMPPQPVCGEDGQPAANALTDQKLYDQLIDVFSMRTFVPTAVESGHDHYAETFIREAVEDHLCVRTKTLTLYKTMAMSRSMPPQPVCGEDGQPAANALTDQKLYDQLIDVFSMRTFVPTAEESGHDHFFASFDHFLNVEDPKHEGEWIDELASRAATQNEQYLEILSTPGFLPSLALAEKIAPIDAQTDYARLRQQLLDEGLRKYLPALRQELDDSERDRRALERCASDGATPACKVQVVFLYQVLRALPPEAVFIQLVCGFELASTDPMIVGINMVQPEDGRVAMANYAQQMQMVHALHAIYPKVHISLHAGELAPGMVAPDGLRFHIRSAVEIASAERIGHGVDVMYEDRPYDLLKEMATRRVMAEINLTSNDVILNIKGADQPLSMYRLYHVPVALSSDDEGVSRINLTHEYVRAAMTYPLSYGDFKQMVRTSLEHSFLAGESLWQQSGPWETYEHPLSACRAQMGKPMATGECAARLSASDKARQQFELERRFHVFEAAF